MAIYSDYIILVIIIIIVNTWPGHSSTHWCCFSTEWPGCSTIPFQVLVTTSHRMGDWDLSFHVRIAEFVLHVISVVITAGVELLTLFLQM